jgi:hypothetical protein
MSVESTRFVVCLVEDCDASDCCFVRATTPIELTTPYKESVLTSSPINTEEARSANALLDEINAGGQLSTRAQSYAA